MPHQRAKSPERNRGNLSTPDHALADTDPVFRATDIFSVEMTEVAPRVLKAALLNPGLIQPIPTRSCDHPVKLWTLARQSPHNGAQDGNCESLRLWANMTHATLIPLI